ncbi:MAG: protein kinase, partial [Polyangiaceae bacterium]|nr:protein kinase [Polyangiaceae bacterium]
MEFLVPNTLIADRYLLKRPIGSGGMGTVWLAEHIELRSPCALKVIEGEALRNADFRRRFTREARAAAQLRSAHVVQVLDSGEWQGRPYLVMEYLEGEDLRQRLERSNRMPPLECVEIVRQIGRALTKAHASNIVHRDLKPANVFLTNDDDRLVVKVLDFGIAKYESTDLEGTTQTGVLLGTPHYMSPEQCRGAGKVDFRSDLWSLAVIVFECLTGSKPFPGPHLINLVHQISVGDIPRPSALCSGLPPAFDAWWERASQRDPAQRFASARAMVDALSRLLGAPDWASISETSPLAFPPPPSNPALTGTGENSITDEARSSLLSVPSPDPTLPRVPDGRPSRWLQTLQGPGVVPLLLEEETASRQLGPRTSAADLPTKHSNMRFGGADSPPSRPSPGPDAFAPHEATPAAPAPELSAAPQQGNTIGGGASLSPAGVKRPTLNASRRLRRLGMFALAVVALFVFAGTGYRVLQTEPPAIEAPALASSVVALGAEPSHSPRPQSASEPSSLRPPPLPPSPPP